MIKKIIILLGPPGSGKGTQGAVLSRALELPHISTGDIFRKIILSNSEESKMLADYMNEGQLIPTDMVNQVVKKCILSKERKEGCILDGYPRTLNQAKYFSENIDANINVIFFDIDNKIIIKRVLGRTSCKSCGRIYNEYFDKPTQESACDDCGSNEFSARIDDNENTVLSRIEEYKKETLPLVEYYKNKGQLFKINAGDSKEQIVNELASIIKRI